MDEYGYIDFFLSMLKIYPFNTDYKSSAYEPTVQTAQVGSKNQYIRIYPYQSIKIQNL